MYYSLIKKGTKPFSRGALYLFILGIIFNFNNFAILTTLVCNR